MIKFFARIALLTIAGRFFGPFLPDSSKLALSRGPLLPSNLNIHQTHENFHQIRHFYQIHHFHQLHHFIVIVHWLSKQHCLNLQSFTWATTGDPDVVRVTE